MSSESDAGENRASMLAASSWPAYVRAHPDYGTVVCTEHRLAYSPDNIMQHLIREHKVNKSQRDVLQEHLSAVGMSKSVTEPADGTPPIPGLQIHHGWQCNINRCTIRSQSLITVEKHCSKAHGFNSKRQRQRHDAVVQVSLQRWFAKSNKYWIIDTHHIASSPLRSSITPRTRQSSLPFRSSPTSVGHTSSQTVADLFSTLSQEVHDEERARRRIYHHIDHPSELTPWQRKSGYEQHFIDIDKDQLRPLLQIPSKTDSASPLYHIVRSVHRVLSAAYQEVFHLHEVSAMRLNSFEVNRKSNDPFKTLQNASTFTRYSTHFQRLICYFFRTFHDDPFNRAVYETTSDQDQAFTQVLQRVNNLTQYTSTQGPVNYHGTNSDSDNDTVNEDEERAHLTHQVDDATLNLLVTLIQHPTTENQFQSVILSFSAAASWSSTSGTFLSVIDATSLLSHTIYCCQLVILAEALRTTTSDQPLLERITSLCQQWSNNDAFGPLGDMLRLRSYGLHIGKHTVGIAQVRWRTDNETLMYKDITYHVSDLAKEIQYCLQQAQSIFQNDLCLRIADVPCFRLEELEDNWDNTVPGGSFLTDSRNAAQLDGYQNWLHQQLTANPSLSDAVVQPADSFDTSIPQIRSVFATEYEVSVQQFLSYLAVLMHKGSGQPGRGTEFVGLRWCNLYRGNVKRNLFLHDGYVLFLLTYHKTEHASHASRYPVRFLLPEVAQLLVQYLVLIRPFRAILSRSVSIPMHISEYLWHNGDTIWTSEYFSDLNRRFAQQAHGIIVNLRSWRQIAVGIAIKKFQGSAYTADLDMPTDDTDDLGGLSVSAAWGGAMADVFHHQAAHTPRTGNRAYGGTINFQDGLTDAGLQEYLRASLMWHRLCRPAPSRPTAGHRRQASEQLTPASDSSLQRRLSFRQRPARYTLQWGSEQVQFALRQLFPDANHVRFRSPQQEQLIDAIVSGHTEVVGILGTGEGKSLAFLLPACLPRAGTTVVIVPLVALKTDMARRCQEAGVNYTVWGPDSVIDDLNGTPLLFVSVEQSIRQRFRSFLGQLDAISALDRIVFDEAHLILTAVSYRPKMGLLRQLRLLSCQVVFLTATLPPLMQAQFEQRLLLKQPITIRSRTFRSEISYRIRHSKDNNLIAYTAQTVQSMVEAYRHDPTARLLVYTQTRADADALSQHLSCPRYYSDSGDVDEKADAMLAWRTGLSSVLVATSAFGLGVDFPSVRQVVHMGVPTDLIGFAQETGRLSRDGQGGFSRVILPRGWQPMDLPSVVDQRRSAVSSIAMLVYLGVNRCLSAVLSRFLDGAENMQYCDNPDPRFQCSKCQQHGLFQSDSQQDHTQWWDGNAGHGQDLDSSDHTDPSDNEASICNSSTPTAVVVESGGFRLRESNRQNALGQRRYREGLDLLRGRCMLCMLLGPQVLDLSSQIHTLQQCRHIQKSAFFRAKAEAIERNQARGGWMRRFIACFRCGQPQDICSGHERGSSSECQYRDMIFPAAWALFHRERSWGRTLGDLTGVASQIHAHEGRYMDWLGTECDLYGLQACAAARLFDRIIQLELADVLGPEIPTVV